jgi:hypothetical protein
MSFTAVFEKAPMVLEANRELAEEDLAGRDVIREVFHP